MSIQISDNNCGSKLDSNKDTLVTAKTPFSIEHILCSNNNENSFSLKNFQKFQNKHNPVNFSESRSSKYPAKSADDEEYQRIMQSSQRLVI